MFGLPGRLAADSVGVRPLLSVANVNVWRPEVVAPVVACDEQAEEAEEACRAEGTQEAEKTEEVAEQDIA